jgi:hypothetical protein
MGRNVNGYAGTYTRKSGMRRTYRYRVTCEANSENTQWRACVADYETGKVKGRPSGVLATSKQTSVAVRQIVEEAIEGLLGLDE